jgi:diketogulonate reductase-like aldo/keto reductase
MHTIDLEGHRVPALGFGTFELRGEVCRDAVREALRAGYRHLDTARAYGNESEVGAAVRESGVPRDEIFLTTKVWFRDLSASGVERRHGMMLTAYSPLAQGKAPAAAVIEIARRLDRDPFQVVLRWLVQQDRVAAIPRSSRPGHIRANLRVFDFELDASAMDVLSGLGTRDGRIIDPEWAPAWGS